MYVFNDVLSPLQTDTYILMQNTNKRLSTTKYKRKIDEIKKYINLNQQKSMTRLEFLNLAFQMTTKFNLKKYINLTSLKIH